MQHGSHFALQVLNGVQTFICSISALCVLQCEVMRCLEILHHSFSVTNIKQRHLECFHRSNVYLLSKFVTTFHLNMFVGYDSLDRHFRHDQENNYVKKHFWPAAFEYYILFQVCENCKKEVKAGFKCPICKTEFQKRKKDGKTNMAREKNKIKEAVS